jgi:hypothetical protein
VQEGRVAKDVSLLVRTRENVVREELAIDQTPELSPLSPARPLWVDGCKALLVQDLPEELRIGKCWHNFCKFPGLYRGEILSGESFGVPQIGNINGALLVFRDEISAKTVYLRKEISAYGQPLTVTPDPYLLRTLGLVASAIFARLPRKIAASSHAPDDGTPRFGGGLSRRSKAQVVASGARHALRFGASEDVDETFWRSRGAQACDRLGPLTTVRFSRAPARDACLAYAPVSVRIMDVAELLISMTEAGAVAIVETLAHEEQLFAPLRVDDSPR